MLLQYLRWAGGANLQPLGHNVYVNTMTKPTVPENLPVTHDIDKYKKGI